MSTTDPMQRIAAQTDVDRAGEKYDAALNNLATGFDFDSLTAVVLLRALITDVAELKATADLSLKNAGKIENLSKSAHIMAELIEYIRTETGLKKPLCRACGILHVDE